jgi:hypothetical protein
MTAQLFLIFGYAAFGIGVSALFYRATYFVLITFFGKNITIRYVDKEGRCHISNWRMWVRR